jgi:hypothetical protein
MRNGYKSTNKKEAVEFIAATSSQLMVKNAAERDSALVTAHKIGNQAVVVDTANSALGIEK